MYQKQNAIVNNIRPKNPLHWIKYRYLEWQWDRVLRKSVHSSWTHYFRANDPDYFAAGRTVRDQLQGYPHIAVVPYWTLAYRFDPLFGPIEHCEEMIEWCEKNCRGKYRNHWERVIMDHEGQYLPNGIGGTDELFFAFKDERDYIMFTLRWS
jgi:hypothetical protein